MNLNRTTSGGRKRASSVAPADVGNVANDSVAGAGLSRLPDDIPPDMAVLLQQLEDDFTINKTIDQWTYINRREEIMQTVNRLHQSYKDEITLDGTRLEKPFHQIELKTW